MHFIYSLWDTIRNNKRIAIFIATSLMIVLIMVSLGIYYYRTNNTSNYDDNLLWEEEIEENSQEEPKYYKVDVKGSVKNPGVYELEIGSRVIDAINSAGGLLDDADTSKNNLSMLIEDEMVIVVYSKDEVKNSNNNIVTNDSGINHNSEEINKENNNIKISINYGTLEQLMSLPGIGAAKANKIIDYRNKNGLFRKIEDIMEVSGIGEAIFAKIKDYITL